MLIVSASHSHVYIQTKQDADAFLDLYCINLEKAVHNLYGNKKYWRQKKSGRRSFRRVAIPKGIADIYSKLCKR